MSRFKSSLPGNGGKFTQGYYEPANREKYVGTFPIRYLSSWELEFMKMCDYHPGIINWASESISIPYKNPFTGKNANYIPDFFIVYEDKNRKRHAELVEIKPLKETLMETAKSKRDKLMVALNHCKWGAATAFCKRHGITFRVINGSDILKGANGR